MGRKIIAALLLGSALNIPLASAQTEPRPSAFEAQIADTKSAMMSNPGDALKSARKAALIANAMPKTESALAIATSQWLEGEALTRLNKPKQAMPVIASALKTVKRVAPGSKLNADLLKSSSAIAIQTGRVEQALPMLYDAYRIYGELDEKRSQAIILHNIGSIYYEARDYPRVLDYYDQAKSVYADDPALNLSSYNNRGNALRDMGQFGEAEKEYAKALDVAKEMDSPLLQTRILTNLAFAQYAQGDLAKAEKTTLSGLNIAQSGATDWEPFLWGTRAQIALAGNRLSEAENFVGKAFRGVDLQSSTMSYRDYHSTAFQVFSALGRYKEALQHLSAFKRLDDTGRELAASTNSALLAAQFDDANRELEISKLEAKQAQRDLMLAQSQTILRYTSLVLVVAFAVIGALFFAVVSIRRRRKAVSAANAKLSHAARHDLLTGLANRRYFRDLLSDALASAHENSDRCAVMLIDLDRFKTVNDTLGHNIGDQLLCHIAEHLKQAAGDTVHAVRLGGDEFALVIPHIESDREIEELGQKVIEKLCGTHSINGTSVNIGATIGVAVGPQDSDDVQTLTRCADLALYHGKESGRGQCVRYKQFMQIEADERHILENDLRGALENGDLSVAYQSIVDANSEQVIGYEALLRWNHPTRGEISPAVFIPIAEEARLIGNIGNWVLRTACAQAKTWPDHVRLSVNVSALQVEGGGLANSIIGALAASGLSPERLELEVTESVFLDNHEKTDATLENLRSLGINLVLDDFGTGYSSLGYLRRASFSTIKIDRGFVKSATRGSTESLAIIRAIVTMAEELGMKTTAEGIESIREMDVMRDLGCTQLQGYLFSRPTETVSGRVDNRVSVADIVPFSNTELKRQVG
ncbi:EAL domain-containing protein [Parasphingorhabdus cellanae]|uniref:EAL domain-containing protein n=1 Tax=Parasphingorhabdus cellanae TaxID=2806553 RepID=A0ABX7T6D0_9SPHN|nr:EAL domain-containing protein [Parasphingorhabdus cellanae]QTD56024.1 EAL domain-containing protein [Parasphingorhabdus cellanae]